MGRVKTHEIYALFLAALVCGCAASLLAATRVPLLHNDRPLMTRLLASPQAASDGADKGKFRIMQQGRRGRH